MAYSTLTEFADVYGSSLLERICTRADDPADVPQPLIDARATAALDEASAFMDAYFQPSYFVPVVTTNASGLLSLRNCCHVLAMAALVRYKGYVAKSEDESLVIAADIWRGWLKEIARGGAQIPGASASDAAPGPNVSAPRNAMIFKSEEAFIPSFNERYT